MKLRLETLKLWLLRVKSEVAIKYGRAIALSEHWSVAWFNSFDWITTVYASHFVCAFRSITD
ncbi:MAG: hypothetical protein ACAF41_02955 [Leptolyngbya sp. BL-A-14]